MQKQVKRWMQSYLRDFVDQETNEVWCARMAEEAAIEFEHDEWLDDETHWVWDVAFEVANNGIN